MKNKSKQGKKKEPQSTSKAKAGSSKKALKPSDNGCGSSDRCVGSSDAGNLLTPKRDGVCPPESFGLDGVRFMDSPFVAFCNGMLSPITPSKGKTFNMSMGQRSPLSGNWTPDLMALFNGKGDFLSGLDGLPGTTPLEKAAAEPKEKASARGGLKRKDDSKKKRSTKDSKVSKSSKDAAASKAKSTNRGSSKGSSKAPKVPNKLSQAGKEKEADAKKKKLEESSRYATPKQTKKTTRGPSRCLDFGYGFASEVLHNTLFSPNNTIPTSGSRRLSDMMPKTPCDPSGPPPKSSSKRRRSSGCGKCNCKKSKCLKLYCECFAAGKFCDNCQCQNCGNTEANKKVVEETRKAIMQRDPLAFQPKILSQNQNEGRHKKGCNCKRSHCLKKYCECFQAGIKCTDLCRCEGCHNRDTDDAKDGDGKEGTVGTQVTKKAKSSKARPAPASTRMWSPQKGMSLLKRVAPSTPSKTVFQIRGGILRPPPSPLVYSTPMKS